MITLKLFSPLPGWRKSKRRRSSSGKGQNWRLPPAWLNWVPSPSPPTCWRRRRMKTCCSSEALWRRTSLRLHTISYLFGASQATSMSSHAADESCFLCTRLWWFVLLLQCWKVPRVSRFRPCTEPRCRLTLGSPPSGDSVHFSPNNNHICRLTRGLRVELKKHSMWVFD